MGIYQNVYEFFGHSLKMGVYSTKKLTLKMNIYENIYKFFGHSLKMGVYESKCFRRCLQPL